MYVRLLRALSAFGGTRKAKQAAIEVEVSPTTTARARIWAGR
jgi:hypothetical protein